VRRAAAIERHSELCDKARLELTKLLLSRDAVEQRCKAAAAAAAETDGESSEADATADAEDATAELLRLDNDIGRAAAEYIAQERTKSFLRDASTPACCRFLNDD
jgi:hypothetical protein